MPSSTTCKLCMHGLQSQYLPICPPRLAACYIKPPHQSKHKPFGQHSRSREMYPHALCVKARQWLRCRVKYVRVAYRLSRHHRYNDTITIMKPCTRVRMHAVVQRIVPSLVRTLTRVVPYFLWTQLRIRTTDWLHAWSLHAVDHGIIIRIYTIVMLHVHWDLSTVYSTRIIRHKVYSVKWIRFHMPE